MLGYRSQAQGFRDGPYLKICQNISTRQKYAGIKLWLGIKTLKQHEDFAGMLRRLTVQISAKGIDLTQDLCQP